MLRVLSRHLLFALLLVIVGLIYFPGVSGPYLYDDYSNLLDNRYLQIESFDLDSILRASFSIESGPLQRPLAMASFAINAYLAGSFASPVPFRLTNIAIHLTNGILVYWLMYLISARYHQISAPSRRTEVASTGNSAHWLPAILTFLWLIHPINLTSVLYLVQRMTSLAALFTLLALVGYFFGRLRIQAGRGYGIWVLIGSLGVFGTLGALSKESALLLPIFVLALELTLFRTETPWAHWKKLSQHTKLACIAGTIAISTILLSLAFAYAAAGYVNRNFTMLQHALTESRVLVMYLSLIIFPRLDGFGMFHDDISLSHSLLTPVTTILAIGTLAGMLLLAGKLARRAPLISLGIAWFFIGHALESTIFPLELAHEHRNYVASLGFPIALIGTLHSKTFKLGRTAWLSILTAIGICFAAVTYMRASQWSNEEKFYMTEVRHHPQSADANAGLGYLLMNRGLISQGADALRHAASLKPHEPGPLINLVSLSAMHGASPNKGDIDAINDRLVRYPTTATTQRAVQIAADCTLTSCRTLAPHLERWLQILLDKQAGSSYYVPLYHYFLGRSLIAQGKVNEAIGAYQTAYKLDPAYIVPLFDIAQIYLGLGRHEYAQTIANEIRRVNQTVPLPRHRELRELEKAIEDAKQRTK